MPHAKLAAPFQVCNKNACQLSSEWQAFTSHDKDARRISVQVDPRMLALAKHENQDSWKKGAASFFTEAGK